MGSNGDLGGSGGNAQSGNGGNGGTVGNAFGGGGFNASTGVLLVDPRQGAFAGSAQSKATSLIHSNQVSGSSGKDAGFAGTATPGNGGQAHGGIGIAMTGTLGSPAKLGQDRGGGLYLTAGGKVTLRNSSVSTNQAATDDPNIFGTFTK
jgi:hypothetical protein